MFEHDVVPEIRKLSAGIRLVRLLHVYGLPESVIGERVNDLMAERANPELATQANSGIINLRLTATARAGAEAKSLLDVTEADIRSRLGEAVFGAEGCTLAGAVANLLEKRRLTLAVAESCTGGMVGGQLTEVPGISRFFLEDAVVYSNEAKERRLGVPRETMDRFGAVSRETAVAMAEGMRRSSGADLALSITGIAGPDGGTVEKPVGLVFFALADASGTHCRQSLFGGDRHEIRDRAAKWALNMIRLYLIQPESEHD